MEPKRGPGAREKRKRAVVDYAAFDEGLGTEKPSTLSRWVPTLASVECLPAEAFVERMADGRGFDEAWARRTGLRRPALIADAAGLGLAVPATSFGVRDVARIVGERTPVQVMRSQDQSSVENWSLADWARYWHAPVREDTLNVISLEFSRTPLAAHVRSPALVRRLDWIDNCFPDAYRARGEYPQTQYYCLMSTGGCYTDFHVDFGGTAVWYHVFRGSKVFYVLEPTAAHLAAYERWICDADQDSTWFPDVAAAGGPCACARVEVRAGETFFIPSGWIHAVHTPADSLVLEGMSDWYHDLKGGVVEALAKAKDTHFPTTALAPLYATGHSAGGACATLFGVDVWRGNVSGYALTDAFSFGSPRLGNAAFAAYFEKVRDAAGARSYRVTHAEDVIPHLPQRLLNFLHVPGELWQANDTVALVACSDSASAEDPNCSDACAPLGCTSKADHLRYLGVPLGKHGCA